MGRGQASGEENRSSREEPSHQVEENTENCTSTTPGTGPILIDSIYIDLGVLIQNKDNQHCSNRGDVSESHVAVARRSQPIRRRRKAKKMRSLKEIYAVTECISAVNNAESVNNEDGDAGEIPGCSLNGSLAPTEEIPPEQQPVTTDDADVEAVQVLLSFRNP